MVPFVLSFSYNSVAGGVSFRSGGAFVGGKRLGRDKELGDASRSQRTLVRLDMFLVYVCVCV